MSMAEDIAQIKWAISQMGNPNDLAEDIEAIRDKLKYDIEPKLDKALEGKEVAPDKIKHPPTQMLHQIRMAILYATSDRKIEAVKALRFITNAGLAEAKSTAEWIAERMEAAARDMAQQKEKEIF